MHKYTWHAFLGLVPLSIILALAGADGKIVFIAALVALIPLAYFLGKATEQIALQTSPTVGALANVTFGNAIELILAVFALNAGLIVLVKASLIGSIIENILLIGGLSMLFGGLKYKEQKFNTASVGVSSTMLIIAIAGMSLPTIYFFTVGSAQQQVMSNSVSLVLAAVYILGLIFTLVTHKYLYGTSDDLRGKMKVYWTKKQSLIVLAVISIAVAIESQIFVSTFGSASSQLGLTQTFIGVVLVAIVTNIAEKINAIQFAMKNNIQMSLEIATGAAIQIALFVVPVLVLASSFLGNPLSLVFTPFELAALFLSVMIINYLSSDSFCNWLEGVQLLAVYLIIVIAFYFV